MEKSLRVHILGRAYSLLVTEEAEDLTREMAAYVNDKLQAFREAHPEQSELTAAVITALALTEELYTARDAYREAMASVEDELGTLDALLARALPAEAADGSRAAAAAGEEGLD